MTDENLNTEKTPNGVWLDEADFVDENEIEQLLNAASPENTIIDDSFDEVVDKLTTVDALQKLVFQGKLTNEVNHLNNMLEQLDILNGSLPVYLYNTHLVPFVKNQFTIIQIRVNQLLDQCIHGAEISNLYDPNRPNVADYTAEEFMKAVKVITNRTGDTKRDVKVSTVKEDNDYIVTIVVDDCSEGDYTSNVTVTNTMRLDSAFEVIQNAMISALNLPPKKDSSHLKVIH